jgi:hypothetical protein
MRALSVTLLFALTACLNNPDPRAPEVGSIPISKFGAWIVITERDGRVTSGELLAIDHGMVHVKPGARENTSIPLHEVRVAELYKYESDWGFGAWGALGTLSTISHGFLLIFSAPIWIIASSVVAGTESYHVRLKLPDDDINELAKWARYPQGMPPPPAPMPKADESWTLTKQAKDAARQGRCDVVTDLDGRVRVLDPGMHDQVFIRDEAIRQCLGLPSLLGPPGMQDVAPDAGVPNVAPDAAP